MKIAIIGAGDLGKTLAYHIENDTQNEVIGFLDDTLPKNTLINNKLVLGQISEAKLFFENGHFDQFVMAIGYNHFELRATIFEEFKLIAPFYTFIHSSSYVDNSVQIGEGVFIFPGCIIDKGCKIEDNVLLNVGVVIAHDSVVKKHTFFGPSVNIAGFSEVGEKCFLGINSTIINNIIISDSVYLGAGSLVVKSIMNKGTYIGVPAKLKI